MTNNTNPIFVNPQALAQAATAALAAAAQQVAHQVSNKPNPQNPGIVFQSNNNINGNDSSEATTSSGLNTQTISTAQCNQSPQANNMNSNIPDALNTLIQNAQAFSSNSQQIALNAQAAALIAAGGINPSLVLNSNSTVHSNNANPTIAAAQAIASLMQNQKQQNNQINNNSLSNSAQNFNDQQTKSSKRTFDNQSNAPIPSMIQHFNHAASATSTQPSTLKGINKQVGDLSNEDTLSTLLSMNATNSNRVKAMNHNVASLLQNCNSKGTSNISAQQQPQQNDSNINTLYASAANNPAFFAQMQNWKLDQLGEFLNIDHNFVSI